MTRFLLRRLVHSLAAVFVVIAVVFVITRMVGDPVGLMIPVDTGTEEMRDDLTRAFGLDRPMVVQFGTYLGDLATLDLGESLWQSRPTLGIVLERLPNTLALTLAGMVLATVMAIPLGVIGALRPNSLFDRLASTTSLIGLSVPQFWLGLLLMLLFAVNLGWLPTTGTGGFDHLILPAFALALPTAGRMAMVVRSNMIEELNRPWIRASQARGLPRRRVVGVHAARNAAIPVLTFSGWELIRMLTGSAVVIELVFAWPGVGLLALEAIEKGDIPLIQTCVLFIAVVATVGNTAIDLLYKAIDPKVRLA